MHKTENQFIVYKTAAMKPRNWLKTEKSEITITLSDRPHIFNNFIIIRHACLTTNAKGAL